MLLFLLLVVAAADLAPTKADPWFSPPPLDTDAEKEENDDAGVGIRRSCVEEGEEAVDESGVGGG